MENENVSKFVKIDMVRGAYAWTEWFCLDRTWTNPYNCDGKGGRPTWNEVEKYRAWCKAQKKEGCDEWHEFCCPVVTVGGAVLHDGWGSDISGRVCQNCEQGEELAWIAACEAALKYGKVTAMSMSDGTKTTFTPFKEISPDKKSIREFGPWKKYALVGLVPPEKEKDYIPAARIPENKIRNAEKILVDNGIDRDEAWVVLQAVGYALLDEELYPETAA